MRRFAKIMALIGTVPLLLAVGLTVLDIVLRSVSSMTVHGLTDIVTLCTMFGAIFAIPYGFAMDQHVVIDVFTSRLPDRVERSLMMLAAFLSLVFLGGVCWFSSQQMITEYGYGDRSQSIGIPMIWYWLPLIAGIGVSALVNLWVIWRLATGRNDKDYS